MIGEAGSEAYGLPIGICAHVADGAQPRVAIFVKKMYANLVRRIVVAGSGLDRDLTMWKSDDPRVSIHEYIHESQQRRSR